jgi:hypothetical protein
MHVYESRHYTHIAKIQIRPLRSIRINPLDPARLRGNLNLRHEPVVYDPDSFALQYHRGFSFLMSVRFVLVRFALVRFVLRRFALRRLINRVWGTFYVILI